MKLILDLKSLDKSVPYKKFKMDTISSILQLVRPNMFLVKVDIKDAYYSIPIEESYQKLLKFKFEGNFWPFLMVIPKDQGNLQNYWNIRWQYWESNGEFW